MFAHLLLLALATRPLMPAASPPEPQYAEISADELADRIQGGLLGQILGNLNGLPHENKYLHSPGNVDAYTPALPEGARTDDDTDIEWVYVIEMQRSGKLLLPPGRIIELWKRHISERIWCANLYARGLMDIGIEPPLTGRIAINPWSHFNISGQFVAEAFGLIAPRMPQSAARLGCHYTHVAVDGEPVQVTQMVDAMIATAFGEHDVERLVDAGLAAVDPRSEVREVVSNVRRWFHENPQDWRATWQKIHDRYLSHAGTVADWNGYRLNTAAVAGALLYGRGDFVETIRLAFNFGWDADCNAATAGCIVGVMKGRRWMNQQGWQIADAYRNTARPGMPTDETVTRYGERLSELARRVILENGGQVVATDGRRVFRIRTQLPANVEALPVPIDRLAALRRELLPRIEHDLSGEPADRARAAYLAVCLDEGDTLKERHPGHWRAACEALQSYRRIMTNLMKAPPPHGAVLQERARRAGLLTVPLTPPKPRSLRARRATSRPASGAG